MPLQRSRRVPWLAGLVLLLLVVLLVLPEVVRRAAVSALEARLATPISIEDVDLNPFTGRLRVSNLVIGGGEDGRPLLRAPRSDLRVSLGALFRGHLALQTVTISRPHLMIERTGPTRLNLLDALRPQEGEDGGVGSAGPPLDTHLVHAEVEEGTLELVDRTTTPAVTVALRDVRLTLKDMALVPGAEPGEVDALARLEQGTVQVAGTLRARPFSSRLAVVFKGVPLPAVQGYVDAAWPGLEVRRGQADADLHLDLLLDRDGRLALASSGTVGARDLVLGLPGVPEPLLTVRLLTLDLARLGTNPTLHAEVERVRLREADLRLQRDRDGRFNVAALRASAARDAGPEPRTEPRRAFPLTVRRLDLAQGRLEFSDATVRPIFTSTLSDLTLEMWQPSGDGDRTNWRLEGVLGSAASLQMTGWFTPSGRPTGLHLRATLHDYELSGLNPYAESYFQQRIQRGQATMTAHYTYTAPVLVGENAIAIQHLRLGEARSDEFEQRLGIPLRLVVALLEDATGVVRLRIPVSGDASSPTFSLSAVAGKAIQNALLKTVTAPLRVLGKIVNAGQRITQLRLEPIAFLPGSLTIAPEDAGRRAQLAELLKSRPRITLELRGRGATEELEALERRWLREQVDRERGETYEEALRRLYQAGGGEIPPDAPPGPETMEGYLLERLAFRHEDLRELAGARGRHLQDLLLRDGIDPGRLFVVLEDPRAVTMTGPGRVEFGLLY